MAITPLQPFFTQQTISILIRQRSEMLTVMLMCRPNLPVRPGNRSVAICARKDTVGSTSLRRMREAMIISIRR